MRNFAAVALLIASVVLFGGFFLNVLFGASGRGVFLSDLGELALLVASCATFVAATLQFEARRKAEPTEAATSRPPKN